MRLYPSLAVITVSLVLWPMAAARAHNPAYTINSPGLLNAAITLDGVEQPNEWNGATSFSIGGINPLHGTIKALHKGDGIYILAVITDPTSNDVDAFNLRFDIDNSSGATTDADDFGVQILRGGQATWGPASADPGTWTAVPQNMFGVVNGATSWTVEFHLPTGAPSGLMLSTGTIGAYLSFYDADNAFGENSAKFAQWPPASMGDPDAVLDSVPDQWGNYVFNPQTTFPNISVADVRRDNAGPSNYNTLTYNGINSFDVDLVNPGGTAIADATHVRVNLYLAARGIGELWHRIDDNATLTQDCGAAAWISTVVAKGDVCNGSAPLPDISSPTITLSSVVSNTAQYTIQNGINGITRTGGKDITIAGGTLQHYEPVVDWDTTSTQDPYFVPVTVNGQQYDRAHQCMLAEAIVSNDPNPSDNLRQVNMNFSSVQAGHMLKLPFSLGWYGFGKYNPNIGAKMLLEVTRRNMPEAFKFELPGLKPVSKVAYAADLKGQLSLPVAANIVVDPAYQWGKTLKENLTVPPRAGGDRYGRDRRQGVPPVYVQVPADSTLWIVNYAFDDKDIQFVDVDGKGPLPSNGPAGLPEGRVPKPQGKLLVPGARLGELVLSFDNFGTGAGVAEGVEVRVPPGAKYLALAINDYEGAYADNAGTGFRVKIIVRPNPVPVRPPAAPVVAPVAVAASERLVIHPIVDLLPQICVNGYEDSGKKRATANRSVEMYRYIGNVCWTVMNIMPKDGRPKEDRPDQVVLR